MTEYLKKKDVMFRLEITAWEKYEDGKIAREVINLLKPADVVEVVYAKWEFDEHEFAHCSRCGYENDWPEWTTPYCPMCGASMEVDHE